MQLSELGVVFARWVGEVGVVTPFCSALFRSCIVTLFQGRGVASSSGAASIMNKTDSQTTLRMARALSVTSNPTAGVKKSSICLQTKFQLVGGL